MNKNSTINKRDIKKGQVFPNLSCISVPIGTDTLHVIFLTKTCRDNIHDVEKLDVIQDVFIHYQLLRFDQSTRLQLINSDYLVRLSLGSTTG
jgi:hypothetical protein